MRISVAAACALLALMLATPAGAQGGPTFKGGSLQSDGNNQSLIVVSEDKKSVIAIFDGLELQLDGIGAPLFGTRVFSISLPIKGARKGAKLGVYLEGAVLRLKETDISLITTVNGKTHVMDFAELSSPSGSLMSDDCAKWPAQERAVAKRTTGAKEPDSPKKPSVAGTPDRVESDASFVQCIVFDGAYAADLRVHVALVVHRHNRDTAGYVNVAVLGASVLSQRRGRR